MKAKGRWGERDGAPKKRFETGDFSYEEAAKVCDEGGEATLRFELRKSSQMRCPSNCLTTSRRGPLGSIRKRGLFSDHFHCRRPAGRRMGRLPLTKTFPANLEMLALSMCERIARRTPNRRIASAPQVGRALAPNKPQLNCVQVPAAARGRRKRGERRDALCAFWRRQ